jgi:hypothetical protein
VRRLAAAFTVVSPTAKLHCPSLQIRSTTEGVIPRPRRRARNLVYLTFKQKHIPRCAPLETRGKRDDKRVVSLYSAKLSSSWFLIADI